jgi:hypothetical protein
MLCDQRLAKCVDEWVEAEHIRGGRVILRLGKRREKRKIWKV